MINVMGEHHADDDVMAAKAVSFCGETGLASETARTGSKAQRPKDGGAN